MEKFHIFSGSFLSAPFHKENLNPLFDFTLHWYSFFTRLGLHPTYQMRNTYDCPVYKTRERSHTYIWTFNLRSRDKASKWVLAGVCLLLQI